MSFLVLVVHNTYRRKRMKIKKMTMYSVGALLATGLSSVASAQFDGPYDPAFWTFTDFSGGSFTNNGVTLVLTGGDVSVGGNTDYTIMAAASGMWSFDWNYSSADYGTFDTGGYLLNGAYTILSDNDQQGSGSVSVAVNLGDVIGYRVNTADGLFGAGVMSINNFDAPVPGPAAAALLGVAGLLGGRSRRRR